MTWLGQVTAGGSSTQLQLHLAFVIIKQHTCNPATPQLILNPLDRSNISIKEPIESSLKGEEKL